MPVAITFCYRKSSPFRQRVRNMFDGRDPSDVIGMLRYEGKRWVDICEILGCGMTTIHRHIKVDDMGYFNQTDEGREIKRKTSTEFQKRVKDGLVPSYRRGGFATIGRRFGYYRNKRNLK
jgi:predicted transcriptional regulator with HTH domain